MASHPSDRTGAWYVRRVQRYLIAGIGPVALAGSNFAVSFAMLRLDSPAAFGVFTFLFVSAQFTIALSAALFGAPLQALPAHADRATRDRGAAAIVGATAVAALATAAFFCGLATALGLPLAPALCYGLYTAMMILRWVGRAWSYAADRPLRTAASDLVYATVTLAAFAVAILGLDAKADDACYAALALGAGASLIPFGRRYLSMLIGRPRRTSWDVYRGIWHQQSRWALLGVVTTEAAANAHVYLVTLFAGAQAMAPIAAAALLMRPINVVQNALADFERPQMAQLIARGAYGELGRSTRLFLAVLLVVWLVTIVLAHGIVYLAPGIAFSAEYDLGVVRLALMLWSIVTFLILLQVPINVMLQAAGGFRALAGATMWSSTVNVAGVAIALAVIGPVWSVGAMAIGWLLDLLLVRRAAARLTRERMSAPPLA